MTSISAILKSIEDAENRGTQKSSHTTNPTLCADVRRSGDSCGICGSYNIVDQGVRYCETCGIERESLKQHNHYGWGFGEEQNLICKCPDIKKEMSSEHYYKTSPRSDYHITKCLDCGAVDNSRFCPNCSTADQHRWAFAGTWKHWDGRIRCSGCGFTIDEPISCSIGSKKSKAQGKLGTKKSKEKAMSRRKMKRLEAKNRPHPNKVR